MEIKKVGVVGFGVMGSGIVQTCAQSGFPTVVSEINEELLNRGMAIITKTLTKSVERGQATQQVKDATLGRIKMTTNLRDFADCDLVIESATENLDLKKRIFTDLDKIAAPETILGSNTSCLSIIDMAVCTKRPTKVIGLHFFNPVPVMQLLEIETALTTSQDTLDSCKTFGKQINKNVIVTKDSPGFIVTRHVMVLMLEAIRMLEEGVADKEDIDTGVRLGLNHPLGPLALCDLIGLDTTLFIANAMYNELHQAHFAPPVLLKKMVTAGWMGRKSGKGFYDYK